MLQEWAHKKSQYLRMLYGMEQGPSMSDGKPEMCQRCQGQEGVWKCLSCFGRPIFCAACLKVSHMRLPFHRVEEWQDGTHWSPAWLRSVGVQLNLGHGGLECPVGAMHDSGADGMAGLADSGGSAHDEADQETLEDPLYNVHVQNYQDSVHMTVVDSSAIHTLRLRWCRCAGSGSDEEQMMNMGLFPASHRRIQSCFTFAVLEDFSLDHLECKPSASNFYRRLRRQTNPAFPHKVPVSPAAGEVCWC